MITRLHVRNFKSLRNVDIPLGPLTVLVGPNMAGKSNVVDVFKFLFESVYPAPGTDGIANAMATRGGISEVLWKGSDENLVTFTLEGKGRKPDEKYIYGLEVLLGRGGYTYVQRESLKFYHKGKESELITEEDKERWLSNADGKRITKVISSGRSALERAPDNWDGAAVANSIASWRSYQFVPGIMKNPNQVGVGRILDRHGGNLSAWLMGIQTRYQEEFNKISQVMRDVFPSIRTLLTWPTEQGLVHIASQEKGLKRPINVWHMSDGQLAFLALLSLIYSPRDLGADLFCIEEPENHLHPRLLNTLVKLTRQVRQALVEEGSRLAQIIVTTQSPYLVDQMHLDEIIWLERSKGETVVLRPENQEHLRKLIEDKELGLGDIVYSGILGGGE